MILIVTYKYDYTYYFFRAIQSDSLLLLLLSIEFNLKRNFMLISFLVTPRYSLHRKSRSHAWFFSFIYPFPKQFTGSLIPFKCNRWIFSKVLQTTGFKHIWYASIYCSYYSFWCSSWFICGQREFHIGSWISLTWPKQPLRVPSLSGMTRYFTPILHISSPRPVISLQGILVHTPYNSPFYLFKSIFNLFTVNFCCSVEDNSQLSGHHL